MRLLVCFFVSLNHTAEGIAKMKFMMKSTAPFLAS